MHGETRTSKDLQVRTVDKPENLRSELVRVLQRHRTSNQNPLTAAETPSRTTRSHLRSSTEPHNYSQAAANTIASTFGAQNVTVAQDSDPGFVLQPDADRSDPTPPWYGGIPLFYQNNKNDLCTLGFSFIGNDSGDAFSATAGHCGEGGLWGTNYNNNLIFGNTSTNYWVPASSTDDIQSLTSTQPFEPVVYVHDTTQPLTRNVVGYRDLQTGTITFDGYTKGGEKPGWTIDSYDQCIQGYHFDDGHTRCHISEASNPNAQTCYKGDSGGPVYQRNGDTNVYAVGLIIAGDPPDNYHNCFYYTIGAFRTLVNGKIQTISGTGG
jgi:hypothetical protein